MKSVFAAHTGRPNTILIVDDEELNRELLGSVFEEEHEIVTAANGIEGLATLEKQLGAICAILLDVNMPLMDGLTMLEKMVQAHILETIPIFLITAETDTGIMKRAYELGVMDVINKPITPFVVHRRVNSIIELFIARNHFAEVVEQQTEELTLQNKLLDGLNVGMIEALATATEFRSGESGQHVRRIHDITRAFLTLSPLRKEFSDDEITQISRASILHDVGKISVPDAILNKPGRFTDDEFEIMKRHTLDGDTMLMQIPQLKELPFYDYARIIARSHHERWDGRGYPDRLSGNDIPIYAQIVSIADVYDALVSPRVYKPPFEHGKAVKMISDGECGSFNPLLLNYFRDIAPEINKFYLSGEQ